MFSPPFGVAMACRVVCELVDQFKAFVDRGPISVVPFGSCYRNVCKLASHAVDVL